MASSSSKQEIVPEMEKINDDISITEGLQIMNNNLSKIYDYLKKNLVEIKIEDIKKDYDQDKITDLKEIDPNIKIISQTQEYIYSTFIPNLKTGRIIRQEFQYISNE